jgi:ABC-type transporter MlaC component
MRSHRWTSKFVFCSLLAWAAPESVAQAAPAGASAGTAAGAGAVPTPSAGAAKRTEDLLAAFQTVHVPPEGGSLDSAGQAANREAFARLDTFFNFTWLSQQAIAPHRKQLSPAQMKVFLRDFRSLIRLVSFYRSAGFLQRAKLTVGAPVADKILQRVGIHARMPEQDMDTEVTFVWQAGPNGLQIVDVDFDGASFIKDYQNQFGRLLRQGGADGLLKKLAARLQRTTAGGT